MHLTLKHRPGSPISASNVDCFDENGTHLTNVKSVELHASRERILFAKVVFYRDTPGPTDVPHEITRITWDGPVAIETLYTNKANALHEGVRR